MKRIIISSDYRDTSRVNRQLEQAQINQVYENIRSLVDEISDLPNETFDKLQLGPLYKELLDSMQDNYKFYRG